jgi:hypothetical protein
LLCGRNQLAWGIGTPRAMFSGAANSAQHLP